MILVGLGKGGFSGLGALCVPVLALAISPVQAAAIMLPILMVQDVVTTWIFRGLWNLRQVGILILGGVLGVFAGYALAASVDVALIEVALGIICILFGPQRVDRDMFLGTSTLFFTLLNWVKLPAYMALGQMTQANLTAAAILFPLAIAATWAGAWLARSISSARFFRIIYALMILLGLKLCWDGFAGLA